MKYLFSLYIFLLVSFSVEVDMVTLLSDEPNDLALFYKDGRNDVASDVYRLLFANLKR
ncbi:hypothetical protein ACFOEE_19775 [Pseudoalteromonas fenneropenaei]|uniref:Uncharacterized protein n=1 Tax=Pseudoalteromonas fenneropenaei TaxID=1737459 RepID=A0ABV7CPY9_9GAMM